VAGPFALGQCFLIWGETAEIVAWVGVATTVLSIMFISRGSPPRLGAVGPEMPR